jgi:hypothetical protein
VNRGPRVSRHGRTALAGIAARVPGLLIAVAAATMSGCAQRGAPSFVFFGAFFPDWMLLAGIGILVAIATRGAFLATGLADVVPLQLLVCVSVGLTMANFVWLLWFGI